MPPKHMSRYLLLAAALALPVVLLLSAVRTLQELDEQKAVYLRSRAAALAARLETEPAPESTPELFETLAAEEPALIDIRIFRRDGGGNDSAALRSLWEGRQLFLTESLVVRGEEIYRAYIPFHTEDGLRVARLDLAAASADFLLVHARHNVLVALAGGLVLVALSLYALWSARRTAELERRQLELEHLAHIGKMAAVLAHEIRNPLGTIKGFAQLAGERADAALKRLLDPILNETARLENLVNDLLMYGRPPAPSLRPVEWPEIEAALRAHAERFIGQRPIAFRTRAEDVTVETDPHLLQQALLNLVRNAIEAVGDGPGEVAMELSAGKGRSALITVTDNGPGLSESARARLFEPFATTKAFGTGLGLPISRKLAAALGGALEIQDAEPHGVRAALRLPGAVKKEYGDDSRRRR